MSEYPVAIEGKYSLKEIQSQIVGEEAGASEFLRSAVSPNGLTNIVTFQELAPGTVPKPLMLVKQGGPKPTGTKQVWSGTMVVQGTSTAIVAYRAL